MLGVVLAFAWGCGYAVVSTAPSGAAPTVAVPLFDNRTFEPLLDARLTERVKSRLIAGGRWPLANRPGVADVVIRGVVTGFEVAPVSFDRENRALEQRITITAQVTADRRETLRDAPLFSGVLTGTAEYTETADNLQTRAAKNRAIEEAGDLLAQDLVAALVGRLAPFDRTSPLPAGTAEPAGQ